MIHEHNGNLFDKYNTHVLPHTDVLNLIVHGCNAQGKMMSGFAKELRQRFPGAYDAYMKEYNKNCSLKLGTNVLYMHSDNLVIVNAITQKYYGKDGEKYVSYDAIDDCMKGLNTLLQLDSTLAENDNINLHFPKIGADLGGGNWNVIKEIIDTRIVNAKKHLYILQ